MHGQWCILLGLLLFIVGPPLNNMHIGEKRLAVSTMENIHRLCGLAKKVLSCHVQNAPGAGSRTTENAKTLANQLMRQMVRYCIKGPCN